MSFKGFANRDDVVWSHPDLADVYAQATEPTIFVDTLYNEEIPLEERCAVREAMEAEYATLIPPQEGITSYKVPGCVEEPDAPEITLSIAYPSGYDGKRKLPLVLVIPGGALCTCETMLVPIQAFADAYGYAYASFGYRTILDGGGYPQTVNDCHAAYQFVTENADKLRINADKIILQGDSSGGHLALALCHRLKKYGLTPRGCIVFAAIVDDRLTYPSSKIKSVHWGSEQIEAMSRCWLGKDADLENLPAEAFPNRATVEDCVGLPPTCIHSFTNEASSDPTLQYVSKLSEAGTYVTLHQWGGSNHDALYITGMLFLDMVDAPYARAFMNVVNFEIEDMIKHDLRCPVVTESLAQ